MATTPPLAAEQLPDGVYLDLPEEVYFAQARLGSSDIKTLHFERQGWWWSSRHNPDRVERVTEALNYGRALHALMLEGMDAYEERFAVVPEFEREFGDKLITSQKQLRNVLATFDWGAPPGISKWSDQEWWDTIEIHAPGYVVKAQRLAEFERSISTFDEDGALVSKKPTVTAIEDRQLRIMFGAATAADRDDNAEVRALLGVGAGIPTLSEVSVLFTCPWTGVPRRARFDKPVPWHTVDLKSLANWRGKDLQASIDGHIINNGYDIQVADQHVARLIAYQMLNVDGEDALHGGTIKSRAHVLAMAERNLPWDWAWLFYQKPDGAAGKAPIIFPVRDPWGGPYHESGHRKMRKALQLYVDNVERFGLETPWTRVDPVHYSDEDEAHRHGGPQIYRQPFGYDSDFVAGERELFRDRLIVSDLDAETPD